MEILSLSGYGSADLFGWDLLGPSWDLLGPLETSWDSWDPPVTSWELLGPPGTLLGPSWDPLGPPGTLMPSGNLLLLRLLSAATEAATSVAATAGTATATTTVALLTKPIFGQHLRAKSTSKPCRAPFLHDVIERTALPASAGAY